MLYLAKIFHEKTSFGCFCNLKVKKIEKLWKCTCEFNDFFYIERL